MIIEVGQVWKKPVREVIVFIDKIENDKVYITIGEYGRTMSLEILKNSLQKNGYFLLSDLTKALL